VLDLSADEMNSMEAASLGHMPLLCKIERMGGAIDDAGDRSRVWTTIATDVPCDLTAVQQREGIMGTSTAISSLWELFLDPDTDLRERDKVTITGHPYPYEVVGLTGNQGRGIDFQARVTRFDS